MGLALIYLKGQKIPNSDSRGPKIPPEVRVEHETCSTIYGTPIQAILDQKSLTWLAEGVREGLKYGLDCASSTDRKFLNLASETSRGP